MSVLEGIKLKQNPYRVPEGYFEGLKKEIMSNLPEHTEPIRRIPLYRRMPMLYPSIGIAASVLIAIGALTVYLTTLAGDSSSAVDFCSLMDNDEIYKMIVRM